jgi:arylsulfatase A
MSDTTITRRSFIRMGSAAMLGAMGAGLLGCADKIGDSAHNVLFSPNEYTKTGPHRVPAHTLINKIDGYAGPQPNIIVILCDDMGHGDLGCNGNRAIRTPAIDRLASEGVRFTDFYSSCSVCSPSRYGLLTGRYPVRGGFNSALSPADESIAVSLSNSVGRMFGKLGVVDYQEENWVDGIPDDEITLAAALKVAGYRTGMVGKWHLGDFSRKPQYNPRKFGFDEFFGVPHSNDIWPCALFRDETMLESDIKDNQARLTGMYTKEAVSFIEKSRNAPFFLYLAHTFPHLPLYASEKFKDKSRVGIYGDVVEELDGSVAEIVESLKKNGLAENTIIVFTSDNGPWYDGNTGGLRGRKGQSYDGGYSVPFIVRWPGHIPAGSVCSAPAMNLDLFPTLTAAAGITLPTDRIIDGKDIRGLLSGQASATPHEVIFFYHFEELEAVRSGNWKYFRNINRYTWPQPVDKPTNFMGKLGKGPFSDWPNLYNLEVDREECYNLAKRYPEVCKEMLARMVAWEQKVAKNPRGWLSR